MPHVDIKYRSDLVTEQSIEGVIDDLIGVVARIFDENPAFVSLEVVPQNRIVRNRQAVDIEVSASPDADGLRARSVVVLADEVAACMSSHLEKQGLGSLEISAWIRVFAAGSYKYHRTST